MCDYLDHNACALAQEVELKAELEALDRESWQRRWQAEIDIQRKFAADAMKKVNELRDENAKLRKALIDEREAANKRIAELEAQIQTIAEVLEDFA